MRLTNAEIGDLIDALLIATDARRSELRCYFSEIARKDRGRKLEPDDKEKYDEWTAQIRRYPQLRKKLLCIEGKNLAAFAREIKKQPKLSPEQMFPKTIALIQKHIARARVK
jgi:hypothetical protein